MYAISMTVALIVCYIFGTAWFVRVYVDEAGNRAGILTALSWCVFPYIIPDLVKIAAALTIGSNKAIHRAIDKGR